MYGNKEIIRYLQSNKILALKLDHAVSAVGQQVTNQIEILGKGATRLLYYTSCFTDEYNDVCQRQKTEDLRFRDAVYKVIRHGDVVYDMLRLYFEEIFRYKTSEQLEHIKRCLMAGVMELFRKLRTVLIVCIFNSRPIILRSMCRGWKCSTSLLSRCSKKRGLSKRNGHQLPTSWASSAG